MCPAPYRCTHEVRRHKPLAGHELHPTRDACDAPRIVQRGEPARAARGAGSQDFRATTHLDWAVRPDTSFRNVEKGLTSRRITSTGVGFVRDDVNPIHHGAYEARPNATPRASRSCQDGYVCHRHGPIRSGVAGAVEPINASKEDFMHASCRALAGASLLLFMLNGALSAQSYSNAIGFFGGGSMFSNLTPGDAIETKLTTDWQAGFRMERWAGRVGFRINGAYAERALSTGTEPGHFILYSGDASLLFRILRPDTWRNIVPYIAIGGGALHVNSSSGPSLDLNFYQDPVTTPMATGALGADLFARSPVGLQIEVADDILFQSPFGDPDVERDFNPIHHASVRLALQLRSGRLPDAPRPIVAAPPKPEQTAAVVHVISEPEPEPEPVAEPEPTPTPTPEAAAPSLARTTATEPTAVKASPAADPAPEALDSIKTALDANTAEISRLRSRIDALERRIQTSPTPATAPRATTATPAGRGRLYTVQVGAYATANAARAMASTLSQSGAPVWVSSVTLGGRTYYRVRIGTTTSHSDAMSLARRIRDRYGLDFWVTYVEPSDTPPADAVDATRAAITRP